MDEALIQKIIEGDHNAFQQLIDEYKDLSFSIAMSIVKDEIIAEEVVQDSFLKTYYKLKSFKKESKFSTWLYRIVVNESLKRIRKKKIDAVSFEAIENENFNHSLTSDSLQQLKQEEQKKYIQKVLNEMNEKESLMLNLHYLSEKSIKEIEEITSLSMSNIKVILHRARNSFYKKLNFYLKQEITSIL